MKTKFQLLVISLLFSALLNAQGASRSVGWNSMGIPTGVRSPGSGGISATLSDRSGNLYIAGSFTEICGVLANRIAKWDGNSWTSLGTGMNNSVTSMAIDTNGIIYAAGTFTTAGGISANRIARWDGLTWLPLGSGISSGSFIHSLAIDQNNQLVAAGSFTSIGGVAAGNIAKWNGSSWSPIGVGYTSLIYSVAVDKTSNEIYAGGAFSGHVSKWDGSSWSVCGGGTDATVSMIAFSNDNELYAVGGFTSAGGAAATSHIAKWNGSSWSSVGGGSPLPLQRLAFDELNNLFVSQTGSPYKIQKWDGSSWTDVGTPSSFSAASSLTTIGEDLFTVGGFTRIDTVTVNKIAHWNGNQWLSFGYGINGYITAIAEDKLSGALYVGGYLTSYGNAVGNHILKWNGHNWSMITDPNGIGVSGGSIYAMECDGLGNLYVGGGFGAIDSVAVGNFAKWDGANWSAVAPPLSDEVHAIAIDTLGNIYVGGDFVYAGATLAAHIAKWDGTAWSDLDLGLSGERVADILIDRFQNLYVAGEFLSAGSSGIPASCVAKWDGLSWSALGSGVNQRAMDLIMDASNNLYVAGVFDTAGGLSAKCVAKWNGSSWSAVGNLFSAGAATDGAYALAIDSLGAVYAGGVGLSAGGPSGTSSLVKWDGASWTDIGVMKGGQWNDIYTICINDCRIYAAGEFRNMDGIPTSNIAWYGDTSTPTVTLDLSAVDTLCANLSPVPLTGASPAGGNFYGTGVAGNTFDPSIAGDGIHTITYDYNGSSGCSSYATDFIYVSLCTAIDKIEKERSSLNIFPNPSSSFIHISVEGEDISSYEISMMNMLGQVLKINPAQATISVSGLSSGLYFLSVASKDGKKKFNGKFMKH